MVASAQQQTARGQDACHAVILDLAGVLSGGNDRLFAALHPLEQLGGDVHIITIPSTENLDLDELTLRQECPSWQSGTGARKSTLILLMVSPQSRKMGLYYGEAWHRALDDHWNRIKNEAMGPRFRDGDFIGGFVAALGQLARRLTAAQEDAIHPVMPQTITTTTTIQEATDMSGLWYVLYGVLALAGLGGIGWIFYFVITEDERKKQTQ